MTAMECIYVDEVPVLFGPDPGPVVARLAPLGDRVRVGTWTGEFPLTGDLLARSLQLCDDTVGPLLPAEWRL